MVVWTADLLDELKGSERVEWWVAMLAMKLVVQMAASKEMLMVDYLAAMTASM